MSADQAELHRRAVEEFGARVRAVADDQWELATPCADWNVRQLVNHLVYENRWTVPLMTGGTIAEVGDRYEGDLLGDRPIQAWDESSAEAVGADERLDPELVDACAAWFASMEDLYRSIEAIGPRAETPPGADAQTTLLAAFGRTA